MENYHRKLLIEDDGISIYLSLEEGRYLVYGGKYLEHIVDYRKSICTLKHKQGWNLNNIKGLFAYLSEKNITSLAIDMWITQNE